jgi:acetyltransferase-like isoleucine patch superfamily enzyme
MTSASLIQDSIMLNSIGNESSAFAASKTPLPISIGNNVWLCGQVSILQGSQIGNDSVVAAGSITHDTKIGDYLLAMGSPSTATMPIDKLIALEGRQ